jgi:hypothetical protein
LAHSLLKGRRNKGQTPRGCRVDGPTGEAEKIFITDISMLAIPVLRSRVAPVLDWCSRIQIFPLEPSSEGAGQELFLPHLEADQRLQVLEQKGVTTLICGALSAELLHFARRLRINIICGVAGEIPDVFRSYQENRLDQPRFRLPGCRGPQCYRGGASRQRGSCRRMGDEGDSLSSPPASGRNREEMCLCPACGATVAHKRGIPCFNMRCSHCGQAMVRA